MSLRRCSVGQTFLSASASGTPRADSAGQECPAEAGKNACPTMMNLNGHMSRTFNVRLMSLRRCSVGQTFFSASASGTPRADSAGQECPAEAGKNACPTIDAPQWAHEPNIQHRTSNVEPEEPSAFPLPEYPER